MNFIEKLKDKKCLVIGAGITGMAVQKALSNFGAKVVVFDEKKSSQSGVVNTIPDEIDLAVVSPGWRFDHQVIKDLRISGAQIISEIDFAWEVKNVLSPNQKWIALTGTNGKTTTIKMVESIFNSANIKGKACGLIMRIWKTNCSAAGSCCKPTVKSVAGAGWSSWACRD